VCGLGCSCTLLSAPRAPESAPVGRRPLVPLPTALFRSQPLSSLSLPLHQSRDIHLDSFTLLFHGHELLADAKLELNYGR